MRKRRNKKKKKNRKGKCKSKVAHNTEQDAKYAIMRTLKNNFIFHKLNAYECKHCGKWHIGRTKHISYTRFEQLLKEKPT
jgi:hypothetical protein